MVAIRLEPPGQACNAWEQCGPDGASQGSYRRSQSVGGCGAVSVGR